MDLLVSVPELATWARTDIDSDDPFAVMLLGQLTDMLHDAGDPTWTTETLPRRAKRIALELAKNYYLNPDLNVSETTGPVAERKADAAVRAMEFTEDELAIIASLVDTAAADTGGLWTLSTTRGPIEMHPSPTRDAIYVPQYVGPYAATGIAYFDPADPVLPPEVTTP